MSNSRYIGSYPVIGIRPIIDGRRGPMKLRESLEDQVMAMANAAKKLFEENLFYSNGEKVKVVIADSTIGRVPEAAACAATGVASLRPCYRRFYAAHHCHHNRCQPQCRCYHGAYDTV